MVAGLSTLVEPIAKALLKHWVGDTGAAVGVSLLKLVQKHFTSEAEAKDAQAAARKVAREVVDQVAAFAARERLAEEVVQNAAVELAATIDQAVSIDRMLDGGLDAGRIVAAVQRDHPSPFRRGEPEHDAHALLLRALVDAVLLKLPEMKAFQLRFQAKVLGFQEQSARQLEQLTEAQSRREETWSKFERDYCTGLAERLNRVEIIGLNNLDSSSSESDLSIAYLSLAARLREDSGTARVDFETLLAVLPLLGNRIVLEGAAGSGKTTLMRWTAVEAARGLGRPLPDIDALPGLDHWLPADRPRPGRRDDGAEGEERTAARAQLKQGLWRRRLPLLVSLRMLKDHRLELDRAWSQHVSIGPPSAEWAAAQRDGQGRRLLLLLDGLDEVPAGARRGGVVADIAALSRMYPDMQIVLTSRPGALAAEDLADWPRVGVEELDEAQRADFVAHWHRALAARRRMPEDDPVIAALRDGVLNELEASPALARLATNPLLCAALCALHWLERKPKAEEGWQTPAQFDGFPPGAVLPSGLWPLCEQLTQMMVHARDERRDLPQEALSDLDYPMKREILSRIAFAMTSGEMLSALTRREAVDQVAAAIASFARTPRASPAEILDGLILRSGVLRGAGSDSVEFIHNTLKSFLAAKFHLGLNVPKDLVKRLLQAEEEEIASGLDELAVFAAASPDHAAYAKTLVETLLQAIEKRTGLLGRLVHGRNPSAVRRLQVLALRCEAAAVGLPAALRQRARALVAEVFPPRSVAEARQLSSLGNDALPHLRWQAMPDFKAEAASARCLRLIGTQQAWELLWDYAGTRYPDTAEELVAAGIEPLEIAFARDLVTKSPSYGFTELRKAITTLGPLADAMPEADVIDVSQCKSVSDWAELARFPKLQDLHAAQSGIRDLAVLASPQIRRIDVRATSVGTLDPLSHCLALEEINCSSTQVADLRPIAGLPALRVVKADSCKRLGSVAPLEEATALRELDISFTGVVDVRPLSGLPGLESLDITGLGKVRFAPLKALTGLAKLRASYVDDPDTSALAGMTNLRQLALVGVPLARLDDLRGMTALRDLTLDGCQASDLSPLAAFSQLTYLSLDDMPVADIRPLSSMHALHYLTLSNTKLVTLGALESLGSLDNLDLGRCAGVSDVTPLQALLKLETLDLSRTGVRTLAPILGLPVLRTLHLLDTPIDDFRPLLRMPSLRSLSLSQATLAADPPGLRELRARGVNVAAY